MKKKEWFSDWFNTPYYHILYKNRNNEEAQHFISNLIEFLSPEKNHKFLDLACGKGRHSIFLNSLGFNVSGCDLSGNSVVEAKKKEKEGLHFFVHDMRESTNRKFDFVFNLFTSIGYFEDQNDNQKTFNSVSKDLNDKGIFVIDFLNEIKVRQEMIPLENKSIDNINFEIRKNISSNFIEKNIRFKVNDEDYSFQEKVELISLQKFTEYAHNSGFELLHTFGDYKLQPFNSNSERLIMIFRKK